MLRGEYARLFAQLDYDPFYVDDEPPSWRERVKLACSLPLIVLLVLWILVRDK